ncbi:acyl-CoA dehydrogenase family protein [Nocardia transvalensis]|uniref:acyl-CoA dehydrogenase family protein n=1 Tax=Nocardia transvalensis TaxID=37333 RepID=UPI0018933900|nr:acyl-CoA dehydrogenase family protein [Nocardia transvalensis]MBF6330029.1 acyl-CoA dehydrogenase family protein [Nocardia transvalensis]
MTADILGEHDQAREDSAFRESVRSALAETVLPRADHWERQGFIDRDLWPDLGARGLLNIGLSGPQFLRSAIFLEELGRTGYAGVRASIAVHAYMAAYYLACFGTDEQQRRYLDGLRRGELVVGLAVSEPDAGSDLRDLRTRAEQAAEGYRVTGTKSPVANGLQADVLITLATTSAKPLSNALAGASLLIVDLRDVPVRRTATPMLGWRSAGICRIDLHDTPVAAGNLLGRRNRALLHLMAALDFERLVAGLLALGGARHCLELTLSHVRTRILDGASLGSRQVIRHRLSALVSELDVLTASLYRAARLHSLGQLDTYTAANAKLRATELAAEAARTCLQYHGVRGYREDAAPARIYRDAAGAVLAAGPSEVMHELMSENIEQVVRTPHPADPSVHRR